MTGYREGAQQALADGFTYFDQLGYRVAGGGFEIWLRVMEPVTFAVRVLKTQVESVAGLESVADLWGGAAWAEEEFRDSSRRAAACLTSSGGLPHSEESK